VRTIEEELHTVAVLLFWRSMKPAFNIVLLDDRAFEEVTKAQGMSRRLLLRLDEFDPISSGRMPVQSR
jgi:hypothetical protein